jgi:uroporphyrinogen decarboxylase
MTHKEMTSYERVMTALKGGQPDRVPIVPIIREWCAKQVGFRFIDIMTNVEKHVYAQYFCLRHIGYDAVWDLDGVHAESEAMGSVLKIHEDMPPSVLEPAVKNYDRDLGKLRIPDPQKDGRLPLILEGNRRLKELCEDQYPVVGYIQAPFRHASMLRGAEDAYRDMLRNPNDLKKLLEIATESLIVYGIAVARAGADIIFMPDPTSSGDAISRAAWEEFGFPCTKKLVSEIKKNAEILMILHVCGNTNDRLDSFAQTGVDGLSLDSKVDLAKAREALGDSICLIGNVDPIGSLLNGKPEDVAKETEYCIRSAGKKGNFILSSGCLMPPEAPPDNVQAMVDTAKKIGLYPLD